MDEELEIIRQQKLATLREPFGNKNTDQNNVNSKKITKRALLTRLLPTLIAGGCIVSAQNAQQPTIFPGILPKVHAQPTAATNYPASYIIYESSGTYYARNGVTGAVSYSGGTADVVINDVINALTTGGLIHLVYNTAFNLSKPLVFNNGGAPTTHHWILEGEGNTSIIQQN
ncbi:MAG TPA: hypothetical protein VJZ03_08425, partial [Candidatus Bathyarchaeia archaeon]|nr:hypothetical protein [Candidatus Bathyarchaeia archaeon]